VDEAVVQFQKALAIKPGYAEAHNNLGNALVQKGQTDEAILHYQQALALRPDYADAHFNLGNALLQTGRVDEVILHYQKALALQPNHARAENNLGNALLQKGRVDEAVVHYQKALALQPGYAEARNNLGNALLQTGRVEEAVVQFQQALALQPGLAAAQNNLARIAWMMAASPDAAVRNGTKAVELARQTDQLSGGKNPMMAGTLAAAYAEAGKFDEAIAAAQRALQLANGQKSDALAATLEAQLKLYQAGSPFRDTGASH
jgi:tetratricopeptide (TPR) repeat protein